MLSLAEAMSERHGVLIHYDADEVTPQIVNRMAHLFGQVSSGATFDLRAGGVLSVFLFAEPSAAARCYETLRFLVDENETRITNVGWIDEDDVAKLVNKTYVRARWQPPSATEMESGYLLLLTRSSKDGESGEAVARLARGLALEVHEDDKEGGRLFMRYVSEDAADEARRELVARFPQVRYAVSFIDKAEFDLATQTNH